ncbi:MAG: FimB/Mfa2 family fimbrial subunit [Rikenellaceae bacterium]
MIICKKAYRISRYALNKLSILLCVLLLVSCEWVKDDLSGCETGTWLRFSYTYNILDVDAAYNQVDNLSILIFDDQGKLVEVLEVDYLQFQQDNAMVRIEQPEGDYKVLVWGGLSDTNYDLSELIIGETLYEDVILSLYKSDEASENSSLLDYLFHSNLDNLTVTDYYKIVDVPLVKNTNHFSILIQSDSYEDLEISDLGIVIRSDNGAMDYGNNIIDNNYVNYTPYEKFTTEVTNTSEEGETYTSTMFVSYLNTLRLMTGGSTSLSIIHKETDERLVNISLIQYLLLTRSYYGSDAMGEQEYLDRQDSYSLIFFLEKSSSSLSGYICTKVSVNGWTIRFNEAELEK